MADIDSESQESLLFSDEKQGHDVSIGREGTRRLVAAATLFMMSVVLFFGTLINSRVRMDAECARQLSPYSPAMEAVEYEWVTYQNKFDQVSPYRGQPSTEIEEAWQDLLALELISVPIEKLPALNKSTTGPWRYLSESQGGGVGGFIEVFHQLHCLNLVRQYTYRDSYNYSHEPPFRDTPGKLRQHVDHCIETIRLNLMCAGDVTPFLSIVKPDVVLGEAPDFETLHNCRNFDKLVDWSKAHSVSKLLLKNEKHD